MSTSTNTQNNIISNIGIPSKVFLPFDHDHYEKYKDMYYVFFLINRNILIKANSLEPNSFLNLFS